MNKALQHTANASQRRESSDIEVSFGDTTTGRLPRPSALSESLL